MTRFFDTSALAKRYISEPGTAMVRTALRAHAVLVARVTYAELAASVARAARMAAITPAQRQASGSPVEFWTTDETVGAAAIAEGLRVVIPQ